MVHYPKEMPSKHDAIVALYSIHEFAEVAVVVVAEEVAVGVVVAVVEVIADVVAELVVPVEVF